MVNKLKIYLTFLFLRYNVSKNIERYINMNLIKTKDYLEREGGRFNKKG